MRGICVFLVSKSEFQGKGNRKTVSLSWYGVKFRGTLQTHRNFESIINRKRLRFRMIGVKIWLRKMHLAAIDKMKSY